MKPAHPEKDPVTGKFIGSIGASVGQVTPKDLATIRKLIKDGPKFPTAIAAEIGKGSDGHAIEGVRRYLEQLVSTGEATFAYREGKKGQQVFNGFQATPKLVELMGKGLA